MEAGEDYLAAPRACRMHRSSGVLRLDAALHPFEITTLKSQKPSLRKLKGKLR
jgi:hypothetical protein